MKVWYTKGETINTGDYNSTKVSVGAEAEASDTTFDRLYKKVKAFVDAKVDEEVDKIIKGQA